MAKSRSYDYKPPSFEATVDRAERKGSMFDSMFKDAKFYRPRQGANLLRILPPGWPNAAHYGLSVMVHRGVGPNDRQYLCLRENVESPHKRCPVCEELYRLGGAATQEERQQLRPKANVVMYVVDRDAEQDGVQLWITSPTTDSEVAAQSVNRRTKSVIDIVNPEEGYDIEFTRSGTTKTNTRYRGFQIMREPSPLAESIRKMDEWLDVAFDKPLPSLLQFYSPEHIEEVFYGHAKEDALKEDAPKPEPRQRARDQEETQPAEEEPRSRPAVASDEEDEAPRQRRSRSPVDDERDEQPRSRVARGDGPEQAPIDDEDRPTPRQRTRPGRDDVEEREAPRPARAGRTTEDVRREEAAHEDNRGGRRPRPALDTSSGDDDDGHGARRTAMRSRLNREIDDEIPF